MKGKEQSLREKCSLHQRSPTFLAPGLGFGEDNFPMNWGVGDGFGMTWADYIYCTLYFYYYYHSCTSDHQALDPWGWGPLLHTPLPIDSSLTWTLGPSSPSIFWILPTCSSGSQVLWPIWFGLILCNLGLSLLTYSGSPSVLSTSSLSIQPGISSFSQSFVPPHSRPSWWLIGMSCTPFPTLWKNASVLLRVRL